jgi:hypothetical protein
MPVGVRPKDPEPQRPQARPDDGER